MQHLNPHAIAPPPEKDEDLPGYIERFLVANGMSSEAAHLEVSGFEPYSLRPTANYAYEAMVALEEADLYRARFHRLRVAMITAPALFLISALWFVLSPLVPDLLWLIVNYALGAAIIVALAILWRHR